MLLLSMKQMSAINIVNVQKNIQKLILSIRHIMYMFCPVNLGHKETQQCHGGSLQQVRNNCQLVDLYSI